MLRVLISTITVIALFSFLPSGPGGLGGSAVYASGGGDGPNLFNKKPKKKAFKKQPQKPANKKKPKKAAKKEPQGPFIPNTDSLRASRNGPAQQAHDKLHKYAKEDNLKGLATSAKRMKAFKSMVDGLVDRAKTAEQKIDANNVYTQLQRYRGAHKKNAALGYYANGILRGLAAMSAYERYMDADGKAAVAERFGDVGKKVDARIALEDARKDYSDARNRVPKGLRPLHPEP
ncbi:hypothetical protein [Roseovarius pelagicus]|uniref:LTXXQ motif family protein n=1 Tax=Roseovarius pelagicus TaxID=2980108 RepID=A0ABY6DBE0_9RHOB|nr:hypothetical protein [Roseovarius pelagicus]UXX83423.1 hypothetical protein N7U68_01690 [Roseovarius pelagicus]